MLDISNFNTKFLIAINMVCALLIFPLVNFFKLICSKFQYIKLNDNNLHITSLNSKSLVALCNISNFT